MNFIVTLTSCRIPSFMRNQLHGSFELVTNMPNTLCISRFKGSPIIPIYTNYYVVDIHEDCYMFQILIAPPNKNKC